MWRKVRKHSINSREEYTVTKRGDGIGGPNAEYALALAIRLEGADGIYALAADTDGAAEVTGAFVEPNTLARAGRDAMQNALSNNDAHSLFQRINDQHVTGPTLTNVNDLREILILPR